MPPLPEFLTVAGTPVPVRPEGAVERLVRRGEATRAFDGTLRVTGGGAAKREWTFVTGPLTGAERATLATAAAEGKPVACGGTGLGLAGAATLTCSVMVTEAGYVPHMLADGLSHLWALTLTVREV